jgi:EAL domain-containing protein (putative c-di-GMP-specific phosphodiesterase class I)
MVGRAPRGHERRVEALAETRPGQATAPEGPRFAARGIAEIAPDGVDAPTVPLLIAFGILAVRVILAPILDPAWNDFISVLTQVAVAGLACTAVVLGLRTTTGDHRHYGSRVLLGLVMVLVLSLAESIEDVLPVSEWALLAIFAGAVLLTVYQLTPLVTVGVSRPVLVAAWLDMLIFFASGLAVVAAVAEWRELQVSDATIAVVTCLIAMLAWTVTSATMLFVRGIRLWLGGPFVMLGGVAFVSMAGAAWISQADMASIDLVAPVDFLFAIGAVMIARGWLTWSVETTTRRGVWLVEVGRDMASTSAIMVAIIVVVIGPHTASASAHIAVVAQTALLFGLVVAGIRQVAIKEYERRARFNEAVTSAKLETEISDRGRVSRALEGFEPASSTQVTAERLCERLLTLPCAEFVLVSALDEEAAGLPLAASGVITFGLVGLPLDGAQADRLRTRAVKGLWVEDATEWLEPWLPMDFMRERPTVAQAPLVWDEHLVGLLSIGWRDTDHEDAGRRLATIREASVLVAAIVGPALASELAARRRRERIDRVIAEGRFYPVYQPIVDLATEKIVGFEALSRFEDGGRPDLWFHEAASAGRGVELEVATLTAAVRQSADLPADAYLSLNLSADIASAVDILGRVLTRIPRAVLLEITEHVPVEDYERMMANLYALDIQIRLAVDDAGAGYAGLQHILAIRPHVVKLDAALVRFVDVDVARQAIVGAMVSFASKTGCKIVAEGVETASEVAMLRSLGVGLAQGYFYGHPRPAVEWKVERPAAPEPEPLTAAAPKATASGATSSGAPTPSC